MSTCLDPLLPRCLSDGCITSADLASPDYERRVLGLLSAARGLADGWDGEKDDDEPLQFQMDMEEDLTASARKEEEDAAVSGAGRSREHAERMAAVPCCRVIVTEAVSTCVVRYVACRCRGVPCPSQCSHHCSHQRRLPGRRVLGPFFLSSHHCLSTA